MLRETYPGVIIHVAARNNLAEKNGLKLDFADKVFDVPFSRSPLNADNFKAYGALKQIIKNNHYDVIHCNTPVGGILTRLAARKERKKGTKVFYTAHGFHFYNGASKKAWVIYYPVEKIFAHLNDVLITINEEDYKLASKKFKCVVKHIHGVGVDSARYFPADGKTTEDLRRELHTGDNAVICVGELLPNKNQAMAIKAMPEIIRAVPDAKLFLAGNGSERDNLLSLIKALNLDEHVFLLGYVTNLEKWQRACALSVSCSRREGLGLNIIEGMMAGNPVVATKNRGHNELVFEGINGYLTDSDDYTGMSEKIISILTDKNKYSAFSRECINISSKYSFDVVKSELKDIYYGK